MIKIKEHLDSIELLEYSEQPKTSEIVGIIKVALSVLIILVKAYLPLIRKEAKRERLKRWVVLIETGSVISTIFKP